MVPNSAAEGGHRLGSPLLLHIEARSGRRDPSADTLGGERSPFHVCREVGGPTFDELASRAPADPSGGSEP
jgi:hypothetical protein